MIQNGGRLISTARMNHSMPARLRSTPMIPPAIQGVPVKTIWSREEDQTYDFFRPISMCKFSAGLDDKGNLVEQKKQ